MSRGHQGRRTTLLELTSISWITIDAGIAALTSGLPANKWNRVLRTHFGWTPERANHTETNSPDYATRI